MNRHGFSLYCGLQNRREYSVDCELKNSCGVDCELINGCGCRAYCG
jgi:hypothetical protein